MEKSSNRAKWVVLSLIFVLFVVGTYFLFRSNSQVEKGDWDNPDWIFEVNVSEDFSEFEFERLQEKISNAKELLASKPDDNWTWLVIGNMYEFADDYERAIHAYKKAVELNPYDTVSMLNIADLYERKYSNYAQAVEYYEMALTVNTVRPEYYIGLAKMYYQKMERPDEAEKVFLRGLDNTNNHPDILTSLIKFYERHGEEEKKVSYIKNLLEWYPNEPRYQSAFGHLIEEK